MSMRLTIVVGVTESVGASTGLPLTVDAFPGACDRQLEMQNRAGVRLHDHILTYSWKPFDVTVAV